MSKFTDKLKALRAKYETLPKTARGLIRYGLVLGAGFVAGALVF